MDLEELPEEVAFFGVDPASGGLLRPPKKWSEIRECVIATFRLQELLPEVRKEKHRASARENTRHRGRPPQGVDPKKLESAGWGVVFAEGVGDDVKTAVEPLLNHRRDQAGSLYKVFDGDKGLKQGMRAAQWLQQVGVGAGVGDVTQVPYYLMLVATPEQIPFGVEFDLAGSSYAVGRLAFSTPEEYKRYAKNVVDAETDPPHREPRLTFVGMEHPDDVTQDSRRCLVDPLVERFAEPKSWQVDTVLGEAATKERVSECLGGARTPSVLFTAGHGLGPAPGGDLGRVGALLCAPYPGPVAWKKRGGPLPEELYFSARDLLLDADLRGLVAVLFGCYTAGMPSEDSFCFHPPRPLGRATMASLAAGLLSHPRGALAVLGHVDRAWTYSYLWRNVPQPHAFRSVLGALLDGEPVGAAAAYLSDRYNALAIELLYQKEQVLRGREFDVNRFVYDYLAERDARAYLVYGDPAVRPGIG